MARSRSNRPELDELSEQKRAAIMLGADAIDEMRGYARKSFDLWMTIAKGLTVLRELADQRSSRQAFKNLCKDHGYGSLDEGTRSRLLVMAEHETAIRIWRDTLTERQRESWNGPTSICKRCPAVRAEIAKGYKPRKPRTSSTMVAVERALDVVLDHLHSIDDADARAALVERILSPLGLVAVPQRKGKRQHPTNGSLVWKEGKKTLGYSPYEAAGNDGSYSINPTFDALNGMKFADYHIEFKPTGGSLDDRREIAIARTLKQAQSLAQKDYEAR